MRPALAPNNRRSNWQRGFYNFIPYFITSDNPFLSRSKITPQTGQSADVVEATEGVREYVRNSIYLGIIEFLAVLYGR